METVLHEDARCFLLDMYERLFLLLYQHQNYNTNFQLQVTTCMIFYVFHFDFQSTQSNVVDHTPGQANVHSIQQSSPRRTNKNLLFLAETWGGFENGGLSRVIKEIAKQLAKREEVQVSCLVPQPSETLQDEAKQHGVHLFGATRVKGVTALECLSFPPDSVADTDAIISCGKVVGRHAQIIKASSKYSDSKWVHITCSSSEDQNEDEIQLCENADLLFAIGSNVAEESERRLAFRRKKIHNLIPGIFNELQIYKQVDDERKVFTVISFCPPTEQLATNNESYSIPAKAVGLLPNGKYQLICVCAPRQQPDQVKQILVKQRGNSRNQIKVRSHSQFLESPCKMLVEADLLILPFLPSKSEDFGLLALQAISADLPILVSRSSGLAEALTEVLYGRLCVVDSDKPEVWSDRIMAVKEKRRSLRLSEARTMREKYDEKYSWEAQCKAFWDRIMQLL